VRTGHTTADHAAQIYGVIVSESDPGFDAIATDRMREELLERRKAESRPPRDPKDGRTPPEADSTRVIAGVMLTPDSAHLTCAHCGHHLSEADGNFRLGCRELEQTLPSLSSLFQDPEPETGEKIVFRRYVCPGCGLAVDSDICKPDDSPYAAFTLNSAGTR
jgi:N-methylhydantoinase B